MQETSIYKNNFSNFNNKKTNLKYNNDMANESRQTVQDSFFQIVDEIFSSVDATNKPDSNIYLKTIQEYLNILVTDQNDVTDKLMALKERLSCHDLTTYDFELAVLSRFKASLAKNIFHWNIIDDSYICYIKKLLLKTNNRI